MIDPSRTVVLITGANQGIGFECVKKLAAEQPRYTVILCSRNAERGEQAASRITKLAEATTVEALQLDVDDDASIARAVEHVAGKYGRLDGMCTPCRYRRSLPYLKYLESPMQG
jgi:NAD(P)-dependent dehydrogenase (short-subunit alcohol dehydrogenase family)